jgi:amino acid transporter
VKASQRGPKSVRVGEWAENIIPESGAAAASEMETSSLLGDVLGVSTPLASEGFASINIGAPKGSRRTRSLNVAPLVAIMYFSVAGGPEGTETMVQTAGPLITFIGIVLCSVLWAAPTALMTAELSTRYPENGGFIIWARAAWGDFASGMAGWLQFCFTAADAALYPGLFVSYLRYSANWDMTFEEEWIAKIIFVASITLLNLSGVSNVGHGSLLLMTFILGPFLIVVLIAFSGIFTGTTIVGAEFHPSHWLTRTSAPDYPEFVNVLLWNMGMWESASVCIGEVKDAPLAFPKALTILVVLVVANYLVPIMAFTGLDDNVANYHNGYYIDIVRRNISPLLAVLLGSGQCISSIGLFTSGIFKNAYMVCGIGEQGLLPSRVAERAESSGSPWIAILVTLLVTCPMMTLHTFSAILGVEMVFYCLSLLLEISSLLRLRHISDYNRVQPSASEAYTIPFKMPGLFLFYLPSTILCFYVVLTSDWKVLIISGGMVLLGAVLILFIGFLQWSRPDWFAGAEGVTQHGQARYSSIETTSISGGVRPGIEKDADDSNSNSNDLNSFKGDSQTLTVDMSDEGTLIMNAKSKYGSV